MEILKKLIVPQPWPKSSFQIPKIQAHRGLCLDGAVENTLSAFKLAKSRGLQMFECDCQLSKDKVPIVFHDYDLVRLANNSNLTNNLSAAELKKLAQIPSLFEVLTSKDIPEYINIELKTNVKFDEALERKVADVVISARAQDRVMFSSFNPFSLWRISQYLPEVPRALLVSQEKAKGNNRILRQMWLAPFLKIHMLNLHHEMLDTQSLQFWRDRQMPLSAWTVNDKNQIEKLLKQGVRSIITDTAYVI